MTTQPNSKTNELLSLVSQICETSLLSIHFRYLEVHLGFALMGHLLHQLLDPLEINYFFDQ